MLCRTLTDGIQGPWLSYTHWRYPGTVALVHSLTVSRDHGSHTLTDDIQGPWLAYTHWLYSGTVTCLHSLTVSRDRGSRNLTNGIQGLWLAYTHWRYSGTATCVHSLTVFRDRDLRTLTDHIQGPRFAMLNYATLSANNLNKLYDSTKYSHCLDAGSSQTVQQFSSFSVNRRFITVGTTACSLSLFLARWIWSTLSYSNYLKFHFNIVPIC